MNVFQYVKKNVDRKLTFQKSSTPLRVDAFSDADWATSVEDRRSVTWYSISLNQEGPVVSWKSRKQSYVALSTFEAKYIAISIICQKTIYLDRLIKEMLQSKTQTTIFKNDNHGALALVKNPVKHTKAKHIDICYQFIQECYDEGSIFLGYVPSGDNLAYIFTKPPKKQ